MLLRIYRESTTDELTGTINRRLLMKHLEKARETLIESDQPFALLLLDVDRFKRINDIYGHLVGDAVLKDIAVTLNEQLEPSMVLGRYGGEEFAVVIENCADSDYVLCIAERLRTAIEGHLVKNPISDEMLDITVSIGLTLAKFSEDISQLINRADRCLYQAKMAGRNCVVADELSFQTKD